MRYDFSEILNFVHCIMYMYCACTVQWGERVRHRLWGTCNNRTMVPHKRNSIVWPHLATKEKTIKYPTSAMCTVVCIHVWHTCIMSIQSEVLRAECI